MIKINGEEIEVEQFPDGTPRILLDTAKIEQMAYQGKNGIFVEWNYETNEEMVSLLFIKKHLDCYFTDANVCLLLPYIPNARMDRVKRAQEVFTLKYFCEFINGLQFHKVYVLDAHSDVSTALLDHCVNQSPKEYIRKSIEAIGADDLLLYFPDAGAAKRYADLFPGIRYCYGEKMRDWNTGKIQGLDIWTNGVELAGRTILMVDDIISYGGSLHYSAKALKDCGAGRIYAYATHTEHSVLDREKGTLLKDLEHGVVERLFTTDSLFRREHEKITVLKIVL